MFNNLTSLNFLNGDRKLTDSSAIRSFELRTSDPVITDWKVQSIFYLLSILDDHNYLLGFSPKIPIFSDTFSLIQQLYIVNQKSRAGRTPLINSILKRGAFADTPSPLKRTTVNDVVRFVGFWVSIQSRSPIDQVANRWWLRLLFVCGFQILPWKRG